MLRIEIDTSNAAFDDGNCRAELVRLLDPVPSRVAAGEDGGKFIDSNGNTVGEWSYE